MTLAGQTISEIGKGQFGWPYGIAVNSSGQLVVTDAFSDSVSVYGVNDGKRIRQFGSSGTRDCNFRNPYHVSVDTRDNILVADSGNDCIKAFDSTGERVLTIKASDLRSSGRGFNSRSACYQVTHSGQVVQIRVPLFTKLSLLPFLLPNETKNKGGGSILLDV